MVYKQIPKELEEFYNYVTENIDKEIEKWKRKEDNGEQYSSLELVAFGLEIAKAIVKGYYEGLKKAYGY